MAGGARPARLRLRRSGDLERRRPVGINAKWAFQPSITTPRLHAASLRCSARLVISVLNKNHTYTSRPPSRIQTYKHAAACLACPVMTRSPAAARPLCRASRFSFTSGPLPPSTAPLSSPFSSARILGSRLPASFSLVAASPCRPSSSHDSPYAHAPGPMPLSLASPHDSSSLDLARP